MVSLLSTHRQFKTGFPPFLCHAARGGGSIIMTGRAIGCRDIVVYFLAHAAADFTIISRSSCND